MATTTVAASSGGANAKGKLVGKDYITLAIFGVLLFLVFMVFAMVLGMNANLFWFTHACGSLIGGIVWMYVAAKVPKRGAFAIMSAIVAVVALLLGMLWTGPVGIVAGGLLAELVAGAGSKRTTLRCLAAFAVWTLCFWVGQESMIFLAGDAYVQIVVDSGMSAEYGQGLVDFIHSRWWRWPRPRCAPSWAAGSARSCSRSTSPRSRPERRALRPTRRRTNGSLSGEPFSFSAASSNRHRRAADFGGIAIMFS